ncbi:MAG: ABC transporter permease, partial [Solirubrobacterales bacterium]|nr:ABC transporter permease [Solirubrobacterales bacterium]
MARFLAKRVALGLTTLLLLSIVIFLAAQVLPGDVARRILGPFADQASVDALSEELGTNRSLPAQYWDWISHFVTGDLGQSAVNKRPVSDIILDATVASGKLALLAFIIVVPLAIVGGVIAAMNEGSFRDRLISVGGLSATAIPEFVWAVIFILIFALGLGFFPTTAQFPDGASVFTQLKYLLLPALCLVCVLFGYIARMARAGTIEALEADYTRTAILKGLPQRTVIRRHVLRNSLLPTIAVVATQAGYL